MTCRGSLNSGVILSINGIEMKYSMLGPWGIAWTSSERRTSCGGHVATLPRREIYRGCRAPRTLFCLQMIRYLSIASGAHRPPGNDFIALYAPDDFYFDVLKDTGRYLTWVSWLFSERRKYLICLTDLYVVWFNM